MKILLIGSAKSRERFKAGFVDYILDIGKQKIKIEFIEKTTAVLQQKKPYTGASFAIFLDDIDAQCAEELKIPTTLYVFDNQDEFAEFPQIFVENYIKFANEYSSPKDPNLFFFQSSSKTNELKLSDDADKKSNKRIF